MAILVDKNGQVYHLGDSIIEEPEASGQIFDNLKSLAIQLSSKTNITNSNFGDVQSTIQSANSTFNVFAVVTHGQNSESLQGVGTASGRINFTSPRFSYATSNSNRISTGKNIADMSGGVNSSISEIDGKKWMAMAAFDGTTNGFRGILLWVFTNNVINSSGTVVSSQTVSTTATIFHPSSSFTSNYRQIYQVVIDRSGGLSASNVTGAAGWVFSSAQATTVNGYNTTTRLSSDDGVWAFVIGARVQGDTPGLFYQRSGGYGFGNYNSSDSSSSFYWNGIASNQTNYVGFIFTGDA